MLFFSSQKYGLTRIKAFFQVLISLYTYPPSVTVFKAKVVASVWGAKFVKFLVALAVLPQCIGKNRMKFLSNM